MHKFLATTALLFGTAATALAQPSPSSEHTLLYYALPSQPTNDILPVLEATEESLKSLRKGDRFVAIDSATASVLTAIDICADTECSSERVMIRKHRADLEKAFGVWRHAISKTDTDPTTVQSQLISTLRRVGDMQSGSATPAHVLIVGSPIHIDTANSKLSMLRQDGVLYFPSEKAFSAPSTELIYGQGGRENSLSNVFITLCATVPDWVSEIDREKFKSIWGTYVHSGGGSLVGYFDDMEACVDSFKRLPTTPIAFQPLPDHGEMSETAVKPVTTNVTGMTGSVTDQNVIITISDHNRVIDDAYTLYINEEHIGDLANLPGGSSSYSAELLPGENVIELRVREDRGSGTFMRLDITPGGFSTEFSGTKTHTYRITAPDPDLEAMLPMEDL